MSSHLREDSNFATMSFMSTTNQRGFINILLVPLILTSVLLVATMAFGFWAFSSRQDYKNNSDKKAAAAADESKKATQEADAARYFKEAKNPLKTYTGPAAFGSVTLQYPKTWSAYIAEARTTQSSMPVNGYYHPNIVPDTTNLENSFALRIQVVAQPYATVLAPFTSLAQEGKVAVQPFTLAKVPTVVGTRITGQIESNKQGSMVVFPLRNLTLKVWTQSADFLPDFNDIILPNLSFAP